MGPRASFQRKALATGESLDPSGESTNRQALPAIRVAFDAPSRDTLKSTVITSGGRAMAYLARVGQTAIASVHNISMQSTSDHAIQSRHGTPTALTAAETYGVALQVRKALHEVLSERPNKVELTSNWFVVTFPAPSLPKGELALFYANDRHVSYLKRDQKVFKVSLLSLLVLRRLGVPHALLPHDSDDWNPAVQ